MLDIENSRANQDQNPQPIAQLRRRVAAAIRRESDCGGTIDDVMVFCDDLRIPLDIRCDCSCRTAADAAIAEVLASLAEVDFSALPHIIDSNAADAYLDAQLDDHPVGYQGLHAAFRTYIKAMISLHTEEESA